MASNNENKSLLDDASTLLMFSKGTGTGTADKLRSKSDPNNSMETSVVKPLAETETQRNKSVGNESTKEKEKKRRELDPLLRSPKNLEAANAAAAALAAAATIPLPLKRTRTNSYDESPKQNQRQNSTSSIIEPTEIPSKKVKTEDVEEAIVEEKEKENITSESDKWPVPDSYIVDIDAGIISCVCDFDDDDGFTIQCDHCNRWQHASCFGITDIDNAPDDFLCDKCHPREIDIEEANIRQRIQRGLITNPEKKRESTKTITKKDTTKRKSTTSEINTDLEAVTTIHGEEIIEDGNSKERKISRTDINDANNSNEAEKGDSVAQFQSNNDIQFKKEFFLTPKEAYKATFVETEDNIYRDKYVKLFIDKHCDDYWVIQNNKKTLKTIPIEVKSYSESSYARTFPAYTKLGVFVKQSCNKDDLIQEFNGEVDFLKNYLEDPKNHYRIWGTAKNRVIFHPHWPIYIDSRLTGNLTRYIRRGCKPNVELVTVCSYNGSEKEIKFVLKAIKEIKEGEELLIEWRWDLRHPINNLINKTTTLDSMNDTDKYSIIHSIETILNNSDCGCGSSSRECYLMKVKRYSQNLYKSVKSKIKTNNRYKLNEILNQYQGKKRRQMPISTRLIDDIQQKQHNAPLLIRTFHQQKKLQQMLKTNSTNKIPINNEKAALIQKSIATINASINTVVALKPYKYNVLNGQIGVASKVGSPLIHSHKASDFEKSPEKGDAIVVITNLNDYDESNVQDVTSLPIPFQLPIINKPEQDTEIKTTLVTASSLANDRKYDTNVSENTGSESVYDPGSVDTPSDLGLANDALAAGNAKKKLSFADYRKKLQK